MIVIKRDKCVGVMSISDVLGDDFKVEFLKNERKLGINIIR